MSVKIKFCVLKCNKKQVYIIYMSSCCKKNLFVTLNCTAPATGRSRIVSVTNCWFQLQMRPVKTSGYRVSIGFADFLNLGVLRFRNYCFFFCH